MSILKLFCHVDDFCQWLVARENAKLLGVTRKRGPALSLAPKTGPQAKVYNGAIHR